MEAPHLKQTPPISFRKIAVNSFRDVASPLLSGAIPLFTSVSMNDPRLYVFIDSSYSHTNVNQCKNYDAIKIIRKCFVFLL